jgi:hypothetical protein
MDDDESVRGGGACAAVGVVWRRGKTTVEPPDGPSAAALQHDPGPAPPSPAPRAVPPSPTRPRELPCQDRRHYSRVRDSRRSASAWAWVCHLFSFLGTRLAALAAKVTFLVVGGLNDSECGCFRCKLPTRWPFVCSAALARASAKQPQCMCVSIFACLVGFDALNYF